MFKVVNSDFNRENDSFYYNVQVQTRRKLHNKKAQDKFLEEVYEDDKFWSGLNEEIDPKYSTAYITKIEDNGNNRIVSITYYGEE